ncbi:hypothetical protein D3C80_1641730 [compost metagenome]
MAHFLAFDGPGGAGSAEHFLRFVEEWLQLGVADAEILNGHVFRDKTLAVTFFVVTAHAQFNRIDPEMHARPVQACTTHAGTRQERRQLTVRHRRLAGIMTNGHGAF